MANAAGSISDLLEVFARTGPEMAELVGVLQEGLAVLFTEAGLEGAMGQTELDGYGNQVDVEVGRPPRFALAWGREEPRVRIRVHLTPEQAVRLDVRVDQHRARGRVVQVGDLVDLLDPDVYERVLAHVEGRDRDTLLQLLAAALEVQSVHRLRVLAELQAAKG